MSAVSEAVNTALTAPLKLDIGCGKNKQPGFIGIDISPEYCEIALRRLKERNA